MHMPSIEVLN